MAEGASKPGLSRTKNLLSTLLFVVAGVLLVVALYLFWQDRNESDTPSAPTAVPGQAELNDVHDALEAEGLDVEYGQSGSARVEDITPPGQLLIADGQSIYAFIFTSVDEREAEMQGITEEDVQLEDNFGDPITSEPVSIAQGSNVVVMVAGADEELMTTISEAVATIP